MDKLTVKNLDLYYGQFQALKNVNLDMKENEITAFIGPSGCGKSTLLKTLNRMNDLVEGCRIEGEVALDGENIYGDMDVNVLRKRVGMVFQKPNPFPMSVYDNIAYGPRTHGIRSKVALDEIAMTNGLEFNELLDEIEAIVYSGTRINIDYFLNDVMDEDHIDDIYEYFKDSETDDLEDAIEELGGDYTEEEIRLVRIKFLSEMAN